MFSIALIYGHWKIDPARMGLRLRNYDEVPVGWFGPHGRLGHDGIVVVDKELSGVNGNGAGVGVGDEHAVDGVA